MTPSIMAEHCHTECHLCSLSLMLAVTYAECHIKAPYAECCYAEYHYAECHYSECHGTAFDNANIIYFITKQATLMRRSSVLSRPLQLVFPGTAHLCVIQK